MFWCTTIAEVGIDGDFKDNNEWHVPEWTMWSIYLHRRIEKYILVQHHEHVSSLVLSVTKHPKALTYIYI